MIILWFFEEFVEMKTKRCADKLLVVEVLIKKLAVCVERQTQQLSHV
jgi:hypothetical protein